MRYLLFILTISLIVVSCSEGYEKNDEKWAYVSYDAGVGKRIRYIDVDLPTFTILKCKDYAADKNNVYYFGGKIENADPGSFIVLENGYSADKHHVFLDYETIIEADPKTFKLLKFPYSRDNYKIFCGTLPLLTSDLEGFVIVKSGSMKITEMSEYFIKSNPEYSWIDTLKYKSIIYGEGLVKTKNEEFDGFKKK